MITNPIDFLLKRINAGDTAAIEQALIAYEPYLRLMVRRQLSAPLRAKFDSADIVQSVYARLLPGLLAARWHFADAGQLRNFLVRVARNRFLNHAYHVARKREQPLIATDDQQLPPSALPGPKEAALAEDLWEQIVALCPPAHRELLCLKREGLSLAEIADRIGLHEGSVRRILYDLARRFALRQQTAGPKDISRGPSGGDSES